MAFPPGCFFLKDVQSSTMPSTTIPTLGSVCDHPRAQLTNTALHLPFHLFSQPLQRARKPIPGLLFVVVESGSHSDGAWIRTVYLIYLHLVFAGWLIVLRAVPCLYSRRYRVWFPIDPRLALVFESAVLRSLCQMILRSRVYPYQSFEDDLTVKDKTTLGRRCPPRALRSMGHAHRMIPSWYGLWKGSSTEYLRSLALGSACERSFVKARRVSQGRREETGPKGHSATQISLLHFCRTALVLLRIAHP